MELGNDGKYNAIQRIGKTLHKPLVVTTSCK